jgi:translation initiation factor 1 (eIF-1/SUI1)
MSDAKSRVKELRYQIMLALYLPILLYSFSTFDLEESTVAAQRVESRLIEEQQTVVLGQDYRARAFLQAAELAQGGSIQLQTDDERITIQGDSLLRIPTAQLLEEGQDTTTVNYTATMRYGQLEGTATRTLKGSFVVRRPEIVAQSTATRSLYRRTLNQLRINVPGLENQTLALEYAGNRTEGRSIQLGPTGDQVSIDAYLVKPDEEDIKLGSKEFSVISPPRPEITVRDASGNRLTSGENIPVGRPNITFEVEPDEEFASRYPQDANYRIQSATVSVRKGLTASQELGTFDLDGNTLNLIRQIRSAGAQSGDNLLIQLQGVSRINYQGEAVPVNLGESSRSYSFTLQ